MLVQVVGLKPNDLTVPNRALYRLSYTWVYLFIRSLKVYLDFGDVHWKMFLAYVG